MMEETRILSVPSIYLKSLATILCLCLEMNFETMVLISKNNFIYVSFLGVQIAAKENTKISLIVQYFKKEFHLCLCQGLQIAAKENTRIALINNWCIGHSLHCSVISAFVFTSL